MTPRPTAHGIVVSGRTRRLYYLRLRRDLF